MQGVVVKLDICRSKAFAAARETSNPQIRTDALKRLLAISQRCFPRSDEPYPEGSYYKADGDAVIYILEKPSVALRGAIEFMRSWYHEALQEYPECRAFLDIGDLDQVAVPGKTELTGKVFENISFFEKNLEEGRIYATERLIEHADKTMVRFRYYKRCTPRTGDDLAIYAVDFADPRTVEDSSLIHALFIAHPKADEARDRMFELFVLEYLLEHAALTDISLLRVWALEKNYPLPPMEEHIRAVLTASEYIAAKVLAGGIEYSLWPDARDTLRQARDEFQRAKATCVEAVRATVNASIGDVAGTIGVDMPN